MAYFINWDQLPEGYDWVAIDKSGKIFAHSEKPRPWVGMGIWVGGFSYISLGVTGNEMNNWQQLIFHRHESQAGY